MIIMNQCSQICSAAMRVIGSGRLSWLTPGPPGKSFTAARAAVLTDTEEAITAAAAEALQNRAMGACLADSKIAPACVMPGFVVLLAFIVITFMESITD
jgi:hypothetical protein